MTIQEAIEIKLKDLNENLYVVGSLLEQADKLGIEALKWRLLMEHDYASWCGPLLPGETAE